MNVNLLLIVPASLASFAFTGISPFSGDAAFSHTLFDVRSDNEKGLVSTRLTDALDVVSFSEDAAWPRRISETALVFTLKESSSISDCTIVEEAVTVDSQWSRSTLLLDCSSICGPDSVFVPYFCKNKSSASMLLLLESLLVEGALSWITAGPRFFLDQNLFMLSDKGSSI